MALDLFQQLPDVAENSLHPKFKLLRDGFQFENERNILVGWTKGFVDRDNKIVKEFQTTFHSSFWEFYLYAVFSEAGFELDFKYNRPDFIIKSPIEINVEAVISNIKKDGVTEDNRNMDNILSMIVPPNLQNDFKTVTDEAIVRNSNNIHFKNKKYIDGYTKCNWIKQGTPFVIALSSYDQIDYGREYYYPMMALLYGRYYDPISKNFDSVSEIIKPGTTSPIPIGIFNDRAYEHISGILFSCTVTLGKLTSLANSISDPDRQFNDVLNIRIDNEAPFYKFQLVSKETPEYLSDGLFFFHNPFAKNKIPLEVLGNTNCLQVNITSEGPYMQAENLPIFSRLNMPKGIINDVLIGLLDNDFNHK